MAIFDIKDTGYRLYSIFVRANILNMKRRLTDSLKPVKKAHYICAVLTIIFTLIGFWFKYSYYRLINSMKDITLSLAYYFVELVGIPHRIKPSVTDIQSLPENLSEWLPETPEEFISKVRSFFVLLASKSNLAKYFGAVLNSLEISLNILIVFFPFIIAFFLIYRKLLKSENNDYNKDSMLLKHFKLLSNKLYIPMKRYITFFILFIKEHKYYVRLWFCIWLLHLNIITIFFEAIAFVLYFIISFDIAGLYIQFRKFFIDFSVATNFIPIWAWVFLALIIFDRFRKKIGYMILMNNELKNKEFIDSLPLVIMIVGTMGKKKTTMLTDMALTQNIMFRDKAFELILENDLKFPYFPWINLEREIKRAIKYHEIYNLATCKIFIAKKYKRFNNNPDKRKCFDYDYGKYGLEYDDSLKTLHLFDVLETYAQLFFIYTIQSSLLLSNYSIREDSIMQDLGNFPLWNGDFFKRDSRLMEAYSRHAHILDFDMLRLGKKVIADNIQRNAFEFGVIVITEAGKERGNMLDTMELKKKSCEANQKNDLFNLWLKMVRHSATVDNYPFVKVLMDEQRPESLGADVRDLCDIIYIEKSSKFKLALPFFIYERKLCEFAHTKFSAFYYDFRYKRGDNTLLLYLFKKLAGNLYKYNKKISNTFQYCILDVDVGRGTQKGETAKRHYYISSKKIYAKRFCTDAFSDYFFYKTADLDVGLADILEYKSERASFNELKKQSSYFIGDLNDYLNGISLAKEEAERLEKESIEEAVRLEKEAKDLRKRESVELARRIMLNPLLSGEALDAVKEIKKQKDIASALEYADDFFDEIKGMLQ